MVLSAAAPLLLPYCSPAAPLLLPCCSTAAPLLLHCCSPAAPLLLPCCSPAAPIRVLYDDIHFSHCSPRPLVISLIVPPSP